MYSLYLEELAADSNLLSSETSFVFGTTCVRIGVFPRLHKEAITIVEEKFFPSLNSPRYCFMVSTSMCNS